MSDGASGHWFDRLATGVTRRQALRATVAGAVLTLPLARPPFAAPEKGGLKAYLIWAFGPAVGLSFFTIPVGAYYGDARAMRCADAALLRQKASQATCLEPFCPGFSPYANGGPCDGVQDNCCPCAASDNGYIPCTYACNDPSHSCCPSG